ncbi:hypothetical protein AAW14_06070 [Streptomyces hygroscopicus]|uniref:DUF6197 family protein n=1 Tax=Streptomyces hygroscopicus TaxID=1912 RepID=UPI00223ED5C9|nr:hypothetical protein [Streptomyces hygroscopicus]MCW7941612.1 hypothetical protein [Streptomyces hygroscopicus]
MTTATIAPTDAEIADLCDKAAEIIKANGFNKRYLYDTRQAADGRLVQLCRVDIIGALNIAAHGTPRYAGSPLVYAAERALEKRIDRASLVVWNDEKGRDADDAIALFKQTAAELRAEAAA